MSKQVGEFLAMWEIFLADLIQPKCRKGSDAKEQSFRGVSEKKR